MRYPEELGGVDKVENTGTYMGKDVPGETVHIQKFEKCVILRVSLINSTKSSGDLLRLPI